MGQRYGSADLPCELGGGTEGPVLWTSSWLTRNINVWKLILYKRMLLLKKKKYAAVKVQFKDGTPYELQLPACHYIAMPSIWLFIVTGACYQRNWETFVSIKYNLKDHNNNYKKICKLSPPTWDFNYIQTLNTNSYTGERFVMRDELKEKVKDMLNNGEAKEAEKIEMIDQLQKLDCSYHFEDEINILRTKSMQL
nr:terpene synthase 10-like [Ipomoea batatas]